MCSKGFANYLDGLRLKKIEYSYLFFLMFVKTNNTSNNQLNKSYFKT